jgi:hypothetical protein
MQGERTLGDGSAAGIKFGQVKMSGANHSFTDQNHLQHIAVWRFFRRYLQFRILAPSGTEGANLDGRSYFSRRDGRQHQGVFKVDGCDVALEKMHPQRTSAKAKPAGFRVQSQEVIEQPGLVTLRQLYDPDTMAPRAV